jgi:HAMP domain-containing protein
MTLLAKFNAILIPVLGIGLAITAYYSRSTIQANAFEQVKDQARLMMESAQSSRDYTSKEITPLVEDLKKEMDQARKMIESAQSSRDDTSKEITPLAKDLKKETNQESCDIPSEKITPLVKDLKKETDQPRKMMESAQSSRDDTRKEITPLLDNLKKEADKFHPQVVPAYAARTTYEMLHNNKRIPENLKKFIYREPSDNPTLFPQDLATWEKDVIELFRNQRELTEKSEDDYQSSVGSALYLARPIKVDEPCMRCHDTPEIAPAGMVKKYGDHGFGWNVGDIAAIKIVSVPRSVPEEMTQRAFIPLLTKMGFVAALTWLILNAAMIWFVTRPVARLSAWADEVSKGDLGRGELQVVGSDEISKLTSSFNRLYLSLLNAMDMLRKQ